MATKTEQLEQWYLVTPHAIHTSANADEALQLARAIDQAASREYGPDAGADCYAVVRVGDELRCGGGEGGMCCGDRFLTIGCEFAVNRVRDYIDHA